MRRRSLASGNATVRPLLTLTHREAAMNKAPHESHLDVTNWLQLVREEYLEIPGLNLTQRQVERLWGLESQQCKELLDALVDSGFLRLTSAGRYIRPDSVG
jgi:hypothetical protein